MKYKCYNISTLFSIFVLACTLYNLPIREGATGHRSRNGDAPSTNDISMNDISLNESVEEINQLIKQFNQMSKMMKMMQGMGQGKMMQMMQNMKGK